MQEDIADDMSHCRIVPLLMPLMCSRVITVVAAMSDNTIIPVGLMADFPPMASRSAKKLRLDGPDIDRSREVAVCLGKQNSLVGSWARLQPKLFRDPGNRLFHRGNGHSSPAGYFGV
jgi:ABC-type amino acid transport substrate-binding protein